MDCNEDEVDTHMKDQNDTPKTETCTPFEENTISSGCIPSVPLVTAYPISVTVPVEKIGASCANTLSSTSEAVQIPTPISNTEDRERSDAKSIAGIEHQQPTENIESQPDVPGFTESLLKLTNLGDGTDPPQVETSTETESEPSKDTATNYTTTPEPAVEEPKIVKRVATVPAAIQDLLELSDTVHQEHQKILTQLESFTTLSRLALSQLHDLQKQEKKRAEIVENDKKVDEDLNYFSTLITQAREEFNEKKERYDTLIKCTSLEQKMGVMKWVCLEPAIYTVSYYSKPWRLTSIAEERITTGTAIEIFDWDARVLKLTKSYSFWGSEQDLQGSFISNRSDATAFYIYHADRELEGQEIRSGDHVTFKTRSSYYLYSYNGQLGAGKEKYVWRLKFE
jgi:hypothetical protein